MDLAREAFQQVGDAPIVRRLRSDLTWRAAVPLLGHRARVAALRVFPRARAATVASLGDDETMRIWTDPVPTDADALRVWLDGMTSAAVGPDDRVAGSGP